MWKLKYFLFLFLAYNLKMLQIGKQIKELAFFLLLQAKHFVLRDLFKSIIAESFFSSPGASIAIQNMVICLTVFSPNQPTGPIRTSSRNDRLYLWRPLSMQFF